MSENRYSRWNILEDIEPYSLIRDLLRSFPAILAGALAITMAFSLYNEARYQEKYTTNATFVVMSKNYSNYVNNNLNAASNMASTFSNLLNSDILKKQVSRDLDLETYDAVTKASIVNNTNLLTLKVTASSPQLSYAIMRSIMKNYTNLSSYVSQDMVMTVLAEPNVPTRPDSSFSIFAGARRIFVLSFGALMLLFAWMSLRHDTIKSEKDMTRKLDAKSLGMIRHERLYKTPAARLKGKKAGMLVSDVTASFGYVEKYKKIAASLVNQARKSGDKVILVTSV